MSRRPRKWHQRLRYALSDWAGMAWTGLRAVLTFPLHVFYELRDLTAGWFFAGLEGRSWGGVLLHYLLLVPRLVGHYVAIVSIHLFYSVINWPRVMRLRDLASGLPALLVGSLAVAVIAAPEWVFRRTPNEVFGGYETARQEAENRAAEEKDLAKQKEFFKEQLLYVRALAQRNEADPMHRFRIGRLYYQMGEIERGKAIIDALAPRDSSGFSQAHLWQADRLMEAEPTKQTFDGAVAHLRWALKTADRDDQIREANFKLGELYFRWAVSNENRRPDPFEMSYSSLLEEAEKHLSKVAESNTMAARMLAQTHARQGKLEKARTDIKKIADSFELKLESNPGDYDTSMQLAQLYLTIGDFNNAQKTLAKSFTQSKNDPRFKRPMSDVYVIQAMNWRKTNSAPLKLQYGYIYNAYLACPANGAVTALLLQDLFGSDKEAQAAARAMLQEVLKARDVPNATAHFLLGFDARSHSNPGQAEQHFSEVRREPDAELPGMIAEFARLHLSGQIAYVGTPTARALLETAQSVWPNEPSLLTVSGWSELQAKRYSTALVYLSKALEAGRNDATLHSLLAETFRSLGQARNAQRHQELAEAARAQSTRLEPMKAAVVVPK